LTEGYAVSTDYHENSYRGPSSPFLGALGVRPPSGPRFHSRSTFRIRISWSSDRIRSRISPSVCSKSVLPAPIRFSEFRGGLPDDHVPARDLVAHSSSASAPCIDAPWQPASPSGLLDEALEIPPSYVVPGAVRPFQELRDEFATLCVAGFDRVRTEDLSATRTPASSWPGFRQCMLAPRDNMRADHGCQCPPDSSFNFGVIESSDIFHPPQSTEKL